MEHKSVTESVAMGIRSSTSISASIRTSLHLHQIVAAVRFCGRLAVIESQATPQSLLDEERLYEHRALSMSGVVMAVAAADGAINEIFMDAGDRSAAVWSLHARKQVEALGAAWSDVKKRALLDRARAALKAFEVVDAQTVDQVLGGMGDLWDLRNAVLHYESEWSDNLVRHKGLQERLLDKFPENRFSNRQGSEFFPHRCLGHGCVAWATRESVRFIDGFCKQMNLPSRFDRVRHQLQVPDLELPGSSQTSS